MIKRMDHRTRENHKAALAMQRDATAREQAERERRFWAENPCGFPHCPVHSRPTEKRCAMTRDCLLNGAEYCRLQGHVHWVNGSWQS